MESTPQCCSSLALSDAKSGHERKGRGKERRKTFDRLEEVSWSPQMSPIYMGERAKRWSKNLGLSSPRMVSHVILGELRPSSFQLFSLQG
jgi:hypothetical protein